MKKRILAAMLAAMALGAITLTGCSFGENSTESSSAVENTQVVSSETISEPEVSSKQEATKPVGTDFEAKFAQNPIDADYDTRIAEASTTKDMLDMESTFADLWKAEVNHAYQQLILLDAEGAEEDQQNWNNTLNSEIQLIRDSVSGSGTFMQLEAATKIKNFYREKAKSLYEQLYALDPDYTYIYAPY